MKVVSSLIDLGMDVHKESITIAVRTEGARPARIAVDLLPRLLEHVALSAEICLSPRLAAVVLPDSGSLVPAV